MTFKFHYVSINSEPDSRTTGRQKTFKFHYVSINSMIRQKEKEPVIALNSIMFLLIRSSRCKNKRRADYFKFHYVSINSNYKKMNLDSLLPLNSIMFLLILVAVLSYILGEHL